MKCRACDRPLITKRSREKGIGSQCERRERVEKENEHQVTLLTNKEVPRVLRRNKRGLATKLRYEGHDYVLKGM